MELVWRAISPGDAGELSRLDHAIKGLGGTETISDLVGDALSADAAMCACLSAGAIIGVGYVNGARLGGGVDPDYRRRGVGTRLLGWAEAHAPAAVELTVRNEALTADAHALYLRHGFEQQMLETRMVREVGATAPEVPLPDGIETLEWSEKTSSLFFTAYRASFADRPGFPDPSAERWIDEHGSEDFAPTLSHVALAAGEPVGFVTVEVESSRGWIDQIGVVPAWRRRGLGVALLTATVRGFQAEGVGDALLHVNSNNQRAAAMFGRIGFRADLQRARYTKSA